MGDRLSNIFTAVLNMTITASYVTLALLVLRAMFYRRLPKVFFYSLWGVVLIRLIIPFSFTSTLSFLKVFNPPTTNQGMVVLYLPSYENNHSLPSIDLSVENEHSFQGELIETNKTVSFRNSLAVTWIVGVLICFGLSVLSYVRVGRRLGTAYLDEHITVLDKCKKLVGVRKKVKVLRSGQVETPIVMGILKPRIILPVHIVAEEELYSILLHELVHIKRMDYMTRPLSLMALMIHWFNPFVWIAFFLAGRDMELSCDERVLGLQGETFKVDYAKVLLSIAMRQNNLSPMGLLAFGEGNTKKRIKSIMSFKKRTIGIVVVTILICILAGVMLLSNPPQTTAQSPTQEPQVNRESKTPIEPPEITVVCDTNPDVHLNVIVQKNRWGNSIYDRASFYQALIKSDSAMTNLARPKEGSKFTIDFGEYTPDKVRVQMEYITDSVIASELPTYDIEVTYDGTYYTFIQPKMIETDINTSGRFYAITASWGKDECEYAFAVDGKFDMKEAPGVINDPSVMIYEDTTHGLHFKVPAQIWDQLSFEMDGDTLYIASREIAKMQNGEKPYGVLLRIECYDKRYYTKEQLNEKVKAYGLILLGESSDYYVGIAYPRESQYPADDEAMADLYLELMKGIERTIPTIELKVPLARDEVTEPYLWTYLVPKLMAQGYKQEFGIIHRVEQMGDEINVIFEPTRSDSLQAQSEGASGEEIKSGELKEYRMAKDVYIVPRGSTTESRKPINAEAFTKAKQEEADELTNQRYYIYSKDEEIAVMRATGTP